jgi:uncharacterized membrane protein (UPF0127 family)/CheY-like chemotaxis protein
MGKTRFILNVAGWGTVCEKAVLADTPFVRMRGLLGRRNLGSGEGMLLRPAPAIHTAFMRFPIDALFLDNEFRVLEIVEALRPWRTASNRKARAVLELAAGEAKRRGVEQGNQLLILDDDPSLTRAREQPRVRRGPGGAELNGNGATASNGTAGLHSMVILLAGSDRRFRTVTSALLERRGRRVLTCTRPDQAEDSVARHRPDVAVIDAGRSVIAAARIVGRLKLRDPSLGIVLVGDEQRPELAGLQVLPKWGPFEDLLAAVDAAGPRHARAGRALDRV